MNNCSHLNPHRKVHFDYGVIGLGSHYRLPFDKVPGRVWNPTHSSDLVEASEALRLDHSIRNVVIIGGGPGKCSLMVLYIVDQVRVLISEGQ